MDNTKQLQDIGRLILKSMQESVVFTYNFTRPSDTTAYAAEDAINNSTSTPSNITFTALNGEKLEAGQKYYIKSLRVITNNNTVTNGSFRLYITNTSQTPVIADNAQQTLLYANKAKVVGFIDFSLTTGGTGSDSGEAYVSGIDMPVTLAGSTLYGYLVAKAAYTPASAQQFYFELTAVNYHS
jgi:hypothetical protein